LDIRQLECFVAVAEELHFRRASVRLGLSQPALSERISALEHELGARLLFRTTRQVSLTQAGSEFLQDAKRILTDIEKSISNVVHTAESDLHNVRVSGVDEAISILLPKALLKFRKTDPNAHVQILEISSSGHHSQELISHRTDVAFVRTAIEDEFITSKLLHRQPIVVVLANSNPLCFCIVSLLLSFLPIVIHFQILNPFPHLIFQISQSLDTQSMHDQYFTKLYGVVSAKLAHSQTLYVKLSTNLHCFSLWPKVLELH